MESEDTMRRKEPVGRVPHVPSSVSSAGVYQLASRLAALGYPKHSDAATRLADALAVAEQGNENDLVGVVNRMEAIEALVRETQSTEAGDAAFSLDALRRIHMSLKGALGVHFGRRKIDIVHALRMLQRNWSERAVSSNDYMVGTIEEAAKAAGLSVPDKLARWARHLKVSERTLRRYINESRILHPVKGIGGYQFPLAELRDFPELLKEAQAKQAAPTKKPSRSKKPPR
jgi:hypothetical protein